MQTQIRDGWTYSIAVVLALVMISFNLSCGRKGDGDLKAKETTSEPLQSTKQVQTPANPSMASQRFSQALTDGKYVYLFFYEQGSANCKTMEKNLDSFARKTEKDVEIIKVDRKDPKNSDIVGRLRTQTAPIPLTLLLEPSSAIAAAFTKVVSENQLAEAFPSPKKIETLEYVRQGKGVILCFSSKEMPSRGGVQASCSQAKDELAGRAEYINIDLTDAKETGFIKELKIEPNTPEPVTFVINPQGQVTGNYRGGVRVNDLVQAATKAVKSGCCPPSSGETCPPPQPKTK